MAGACSSCIGWHIWSSIKLCRAGTTETRSLHVELGNLMEQEWVAVLIATAPPPPNFWTREEPHELDDTVLWAGSDADKVSISWHAFAALEHTL